MSKISPQRAEWMAMHDPDSFVLVVEYTRDDGAKTRRVISPIRRERNHLLAFCLCRGEPRRFLRSRLRIIELDSASKYTVPVEEIIQ